MGLEFEQMVSERRPFSSVDAFHQFIAERTQLALPLVKTRWPVTVVGVNSNYFELYLEVTLGEARIEVKSIMDRAGRHRASDTGPGNYHGAGEITETGFLSTG